MYDEIMIRCVTCTVLLFAYSNVLLFIVCVPQRTCKAVDKYVHTIHSHEAPKTEINVVC